MKWARILIAIGLMSTALNVVAFFDLEHRARAIETHENLLADALDSVSAGELLQKGPPPAGMRVMGIFKTNYGSASTFDVVSSIGVWDGEAFTHTYTEGGKAFTYVITYAPPDEWFPYPTK